MNFCILLIVGGIFTNIIGIIGVIMRKSLNKRDDFLTVGIIESIEILKKRDGSITYVDRVPTIKYKVGKKVFKEKYISSKLFDEKEISIGKKVTVSCSRNNPEFFRVIEFESENEKYFYNVILVGVAMIIIGIILY